jgi:GAF domain-containing protein
MRDLVEDGHLTLAHSLHEATLEVHKKRTVEELLEGIVHVAQAVIPGIDHVGVSLSTADGGLETKAATDKLVRDLDEIQYDVGEGPCVYAIGSAAVVRVNDARHDKRWPLFMPRALRLGLRAQLGVRMFADEQVLGGLNLYSTSVDVISDEALDIAEMFATQAAIALGRTRRETQLNQALATRGTIGVAVGIVMERFRLDQRGAFAYLSRVSSTSNIKLREIAANLVDEVNRQAAAPVTDRLTARPRA